MVLDKHLGQQSIFIRRFNPVLEQVFVLHSEYKIEAVHSFLEFAVVNPGYQKNIIIANIFVDDALTELCFSVRIVPLGHGDC